MDSVWINKIDEIVDVSSKEYISKKDYNFYQIWRLKNIARQINQKMNISDTGNTCVSDFMYVIDNLDSLINKSGNDKSEYENRLESVIFCLRNNHNVYLPLYFASKLSFIFMCVGAILGFIYSLVIHESIDWMIVMLIIGGTSILGYLIGSIKDLKIKKVGNQI